MIWSDNVMQACIYNQHGEFELVEKLKPKVKDDTAIIKVLATSICGTDFRTYLHGSTKIIPDTTVGHEMCGEIVEIGDKIQAFYKGDIVAVAPALGCGECYMCKKGHPNMCDSLQTIGFRFDGSFAEYMEIPAQYFKQGNVNHVPNGVAYEAAALAEPIACAVNAQEALHIEKGDYVAVFGSGFIGCSHAELAFMNGADRVIMIEPNSVRLETALKLVPKVKMIGSQDDLYGKAMELTDGRGVDVAIVACSAGIAQENAQKLIAKRGRISLFGGLTGTGKGFIDSNTVHYKELGIFGVHASTPCQNRKVLQWMADGRVDVKKYITREYSIDNIMEAFMDIKTKGIMKAVITFR
ncbi:MAG: alcohol dehydrogenase catalytic domain-containing protein [Christensenella sp.]